ncbi:MAG: glycosyltransferase family 4 protein [Pseudomonadota bacterium]
MKICIVTVQYPPRLGGVATASARLAAGLRRQGHDVMVVTQKPSWEPQSDNAEPAFNMEEGIAVYRFSEFAMTDRGYGQLMPVLLKEVSAFEPDLIHSYYLHPTGYLACAVGRQLGVPVTVSARGDDVTLDMLIAPDRVSAVLNAATRVLSVSQSLIDWLGFIKPDVDGFEVQNGVNAYFKPRRAEAKEWRAENNLRPDQIVIGANARFRWKKGMDHLHAILDNLGRSMGDRLVFVLGGDFPDGLVEETRQVLENHGSRAIILNRPDRQKLAIYYSAFDLFLLTSIREGLSNSLLEAMACGVPVVSTPANGCEQVVRDYRCGIVISPYDDVAAARDIETLIDDPDQRSQFSANALSAIEDHFQVERELGEYSAVFEEIVADAALHRHDPDRAILL